ncbi:unnamed protein product [Amoebophrya sp. A120]|nr:unnamed protein product [Amoebophrya sp. A120]|eukprot:GSA120T00009445001.1
MQLFHRNKNAGGSVARTSSSSSSSATAARAAVVGLTANNTGVSPVICGASSFCVVNEDRAAPNVASALQEESRGGIVLDHLVVDVVPDNDKEDTHAVKNEPHHNCEEITINDPGLRTASFLGKSSTVEINSKPQLLLLPGGAQLQQTKENNKIATKLLRAGPQQASAALGRMFLRRKYEKLHQDGRNDGCSVVLPADDGASSPDVLVTEPASEKQNTKAITTIASSSSKKQRVVPDLRLPKPRKVFLEDVDPEFAATPASSSRSLSKARLGNKFNDFKNLISEKTLNVRSTTLVVNKAKEIAARIHVGRSGGGGQHLLLNSKKKDAEEQARREHGGGRKKAYAILEHPRMTEVRQQDYSVLSGEDPPDREPHDDFCSSTKLQYRYNGISAVCSRGRENGLEKHSTHCHFDRGSSSAMPPDMKKQAPRQEINSPRPSGKILNTEDPEAEKNFTLSQASRTQEFWVFVTTNGVSGGCLACILIHLDSILFPFRGELLTYFYATMSVNAGLSAVFVSTALDYQKFSMLQICAQHNFLMVCCFFGLAFLLKLYFDQIEEDNLDYLVEQEENLFPEKAHGRVEDSNNLLQLRGLLTMRSREEDITRSTIRGRALFAEASSSTASNIKKDFGYNLNARTIDLEEQHHHIPTDVILAHAARTSKVGSLSPGASSSIGRDAGGGEEVFSNMSRPENANNKPADAPASESTSTTFLLNSFLLFIGMITGWTAGYTMVIQAFAYANQFGRKHLGNISSVAKSIMVVHSAIFPTLLSVLHSYFEKNYIYALSFLNLYPIFAFAFALYCAMMKE